MGFIKSYEKLDALCKDILHDEKGITAYINAMKTCPEKLNIDTWDDDLKRLCFYRRLRYAIANDAKYTEENSARKSDVKWLEKYCERIMKGEDSLAKYIKVMQSPEKYGEIVKEKEIKPKERKKTIIVRFVLYFLDVFGIKRKY